MRRQGRRFSAPFRYAAAAPTSGCMSRRMPVASSPPITLSIDASRSSAARSKTDGVYLSSVVPIFGKSRHCHSERSEESHWPPRSFAALRMTDWGKFGTTDLVNIGPGRVALGGCPPKAPTDPYLHTLARIIHKRGGSDADCWRARFSGCVRGVWRGAGTTPPFPRSCQSAEVWRIGSTSRLSLSSGRPKRRPRGANGDILLYRLSVFSGLPIPANL